MQQQRRRPPVAVSPVAHTNNSTRPVRQSSRNMPAAASQCFGCAQPMYNQFISNVLDHLWHPECVRCFICRCLLNEQCYSREGKLYCKDDFIKKYIHRCFACQNLVQSHELIRRIRAGRIYHAECFVCSKCKQPLKDDDITTLLKPEGATLNDLDCVCQACLNPTKASEEATAPATEEENKVKENGVAATMNGKASPVPETHEEKPKTNGTSNHVDEQNSMDVDEAPPAVKPSNSPVKEPSPPSSPATPPPKPTGRQSKVRQSTSSNGSKRSPTKSKTTPASRQKQNAASERKGRSPATRSRGSTGASATPAIAQRRSSNRRTTKSTRYRKRSFSSGSDEEETEDDDEDDTDFTDDDNIPTREPEVSRSPAAKAKATPATIEKKSEPEPTPPVVPVVPVPPPATSTNPSLLSQAKMSEPLSLLSGLAANPMSISSIMKPDNTPSFMPPNFNPAFPTPAQFLPPGFPLQPRLPMPPPPLPPTSSTTTTQASAASAGDASDNDSLDRSSSPSQMDVSTNVEPGTPARPGSPPKGSRPAVPPAKPSALSSLLEFGTVPPSTLGDIRPMTAAPNPFPFPFVTPGPGVPFSPQAAAGMATFYRPPFGVPPPLPPPSASMPLDMSQSHASSSKKKTEEAENEEIVSQNLLDDSSASASSPKKKARKSNARSKAKAKKSETDGENGVDDDSPSPPPPTAAPASKKKKKMKTDATENGNTNDSDESKLTNGNANNHSHNLLAQMGLMNNSFMPPGLAPGAAVTNGKPGTPNAQQAQQAQLAAMYNMAPHFAAYNAFQGAFNPAFAAAAYASGYPTPYGFHPAFGGPAPGQPFPFMPPGGAPGAPPMNSLPGADDKAASATGAETKPAKSRSKSNAGGEKKKATPRTSKKKSAIDLSASAADGEMGAPSSGADLLSQAANTPDSTSTPTKRHHSGTESDDLDEHPHGTNGKGGYDSDGSAGDADRSSHAAPAAPEKKGGRTTIKPHQLEVLNRAYDLCSKPNKAQREQLVTETGLNLRVIQVWFQNRRSKDRKGGKMSKEREAPLDDDDAGDDSQASLPPATSEGNPVNESES